MKYKIEWKYKLKTHESILFISDWVEGEEAILIGEDIEKKGIGMDLYYYDEGGVSWKLKELKKLLVEIEEEPHDLIVYFDGGFNKYMKQAGVGAVIYYQQGKKKYRIRTNELLDEIVNNSEAEYAAMYYAVNYLEELEASHLSCEFKGDSQGVLMQLKGEWPCYDENLNRWLDRIEEKLKKLSIQASFSTIARTENKEADKLATQALEGKMIDSKMQIL